MPPDGTAASQPAAGPPPGAAGGTFATFARLAASYSLVTLLGPFFTLALTPIYTRLLLPADYGIVEATGTLSAFVTTFVLFSLDQSLAVHFFRGDPARQRSLATTAVALVAAFGLALAVALLVLAEPLAVFLLRDANLAVLFRLVAVNAVTAPAYYLILAALRLQMRPGRVNLLALSFLFATILSNVVLVVVLRLQALGVIASQALANTVACLVGLALASHSLRGSLSRSLAAPLLVTGASLLPGAVSVLLLNGIDRLFLTQFVSHTDLGLYAIANKLASMLYVLMSAAWYAWWPMALEMSGRPEAPRTYARMFEFLAALTMSLALAIGLFAPEILAVFTRDLYVPAAPYTLALLVYFGPASFLSQMFFIGLYVRQQTHWVSLGHMLAAGINIALNLLLIPPYGVWGAVWATVLAGLALLAYAYFAGQRFLAVPYRLGRLLALAGLYGGLVAAFLLVPALHNLPLKAAGLAAFGLGLLALRLVSLSQARQALSALRAWRRPPP
jgi:O-antigen/teichoic acid export membrane protein